MNEKILISYIIPAYNAADTLERAVETDEIRNIIDNMLDEEYETLKANACKIGGKLRRGYFLKSAMKQSI